MRETIELEEGDSIAVIRYKLEQARSRRVALLVPPDNRFLRNPVNLTLVQRQAQALGLDLVLVTRQREITETAHAIGLRTVGSVPAAYRVRSQRMQMAVRPPIEPRNIAALPSRPRTEFKGNTKALPSGLKPQIAILALGLSLIVVLFLSMSILVPSATVTLDPFGEGATVEADVAASLGIQQVDYERKLVPAREVHTEVVGEESGQATGKETTLDQHASGEVVFANKTTEEVVVPKGTVVRTSDGLPVSFYTLLDVTVPGSFGATARAPIMAFDPGPIGNVPALTIRVVEGEPSFKVDVLNDRATQGGSEKRVSIVSSEDQDRLRASLVLRLQQQAYEELVGSLKKDEWIPPDSLDVAITEESFDKQVGEQTESVRLTMKVRVTGVAVQGEATRDLMTHLLESQGARGLVVNDATLDLRQPVGNVAVEGDTIRFKARASGLLVPAIDLKAVSRRLAGKNPAGAVNWLTDEYALQYPPEIDIRPSWWPRLPWLGSRIQVRFAGGF